MVDVIVCTFNGVAHLETQLRSIIDQSWPVRVNLFDDASSDESVSLAGRLLRAGRDRVQEKPANIGYVRNFEQSILTVVEHGADYIALSDQDDRWAKERIAWGMKEMMRLEREQGSDRPVLIHSDLRLIDEKGRLLHSSYLRFRRYRIAEDRNLTGIIGENGVMGNTILMNRALAELALPFPDGLHVHDYWLAVLAELHGTRVMLAQPTVDYRLHQGNASNTAESLLSGVRGHCRLTSLRRWLKLDFKLPFKEDSRLRVMDALLNDQNRLPPMREADREALHAFRQYLRFEQPRVDSLRYLLSSGVVRDGLRYRTRLCLATLLTARYSRQAQRRD